MHIWFVLSCWTAWGWVAKLLGPSMRKLTLRLLLLRISSLVHSNVTITRREVGIGRFDFVVNED